MPDLDWLRRWVDYALVILLLSLFLLTSGLLKVPAINRYLGAPTHRIGRP